MIEDRSISREGERLTLDPFAFWPHFRSRMEPLGGVEESGDPDYVFHSLYVACGEGDIVFRIAVDALVADRGTLILRIHELPVGIGSHARQVAISQVQLVDLKRQGGVVHIDAEARDHCTYAVLGHIYGDTIAKAGALDVTVIRQTPDPESSDRPSAFTTTRVGGAPMLVGVAHPTLVVPVSQMATEAQLHETIYRDWSKHLDSVSDQTVLQQWERVFTMRVLDRYDRARSGARGLGIGAADKPELIASLIAAGCRMTSTQAIATQAIGEDAAALPNGVIALNPVDIPDEVAGFDFTFVTSDVGLGDGWQVTLASIEMLLRTIKSGGLLLVIVPAADREFSLPGDTVMAWHDLLRISLLLMSRGHQVAQMRRDTGHALAIEPEGGGMAHSLFGFIIRRR